MSEVTDIRCAVSSGDLSTAPGPVLDVAALSLESAGRSGTSGADESAVLSLDDEDSRLLIRDRDRERSECESGRGVISGASSKLS